MRLRKIGIALLALLLAGAVMVPCVSAAAEEIYDEKLQKWQDDHTIKVTKTVTEKYSDGILTVEISYTGKELTNRFGIEAFTRQQQMKISPEDAKNLGLIGDKVKSSTSEEFGVFTAADDPPLVSISAYPTWLYAYSGGVYYQTGDPVNMIWSGAYLSTIKTEMTEKFGWTDYILEEALYLYDSGWKQGDGVADDTFRYYGGDHVRLWQLHTGQVVGAAHKDSEAPHHAVEFEWAEDRISAFYEDADDTMWHVYDDDTDLGNSVTSPYNNGYAAYIGYW